MFMCNTSLRGDMAKRIMFSILPSVASTAQIIGTGGVVDYRALAVACNGRHDIIKYGTRACVHETCYYQGTEPRKEEIKALVKDEKYAAAIQIAVDLFSQHEKWNNSYGGKAWEAIARSVQRLVISDAQLKNIRNGPSGNRIPETEIDIMKTIVMELNIFDGLSHNTDIVMRNLVDLEHAEYNEKHPVRDDNEARVRANLRNTNMSDIKNMMDSKELVNPVDVFNEIEGILRQNGDTLIFKDWIDRIHKDPAYRTINHSLREEKFWIRYRKSSLAYKVCIQKFWEILMTETAALQELMVGKPVYDANAAETHKAQAIHAVSSLKNSVSNLEQMILNTANEFEPPLNGQPKGAIQIKAAALNSKLYSLRVEINNHDANYNDLWREVVVHKSKEPQALIDVHNKIGQKIASILSLTESEGKEAGQALPI